MLKRIFWPALLMLAGVVAAGNDIELPINGNFRGTPSGYSPAPGWTLTADGGEARVLKTADPDDFCLKLTAAPVRSQSVVSDLHPLHGSVLKLEAKVSGAGTASLGYELLDSFKLTVAADREVVKLKRYDQKVKRSFTLSRPAKYIRIRLTADAGAAARFRDVEAELSAPASAVTAAPAPGVIAAPPAPASSSASASCRGGASKSSKKPQVRALRDRQCLSYEALADEEYFEISVQKGKFIEFELEEDSAKGLYWKMVKGNDVICLAILTHSQEGSGVLRRSKARVRLQALRPGKTEVVLRCGAKTVTVYFTAYERSSL